MAEFTDPFSGNVPERRLTKEELIRALRLDLAAEYEAINLYMAHAEAIDNPLAKKILVHIANEEREHVGEFQRLIEILTGDEQEYVAHGREEVDEMAAELRNRGSDAESTPPAADPAVSEEPTVGALKRSTGA